MEAREGQELTLLAVDPVWNSLHDDPQGREPSPPHRAAGRACSAASELIGNHRRTVEREEGGQPPASAVESAGCGGVEPLVLSM